MPVWVLVARAQFSPGALSKAHGALKGPTHCTSCHVVVGGNRKFKCQGCHIEIRQRLAANRGLHASLLGQDRSDNACVKCHSEHNGEDFVPIRWDVSLEEFDHRKTGYALDGGHAAHLDCRRCHTTAHIAAAERRTIRMKDLGRSYLGLSRECLSCHQDEHAGQLNAHCENCHTAARWKDVARFDHRSAKFHLTGAHEKTACARCHTSVVVATSAKPRVRFTGIAFAQCTSCHQDPHRGAFPAPCSACHTDQAWKPAHNVASAFDHSKTRFALTGKHTDLACGKCHQGAGFHTPVARQQCRDCHKDYHGGQFVARAGGGECGGCHTVEGWKPATFTVAAHGNSRYPLLGRHNTVACAACHKPAGAATAFRNVRHELCTDCHKDPHAGQFASRCETCHTVDRFRPSTYTLARHSQTKFGLKGAHAAVACLDCHKKSLDGKDVTQFRFPDVSCTGCHQDPHQGQFQAKAAGAGCESCHTLATWHDVQKFDHSLTRFALVGAHRGVACEQCHRARDLSVGLRKVVFGNTPRACESCHEDIHGGQFSAATERAGCFVCHDTTKWKPSKFDHDQAVFQLSGAHGRVQCAQCHKTRKEVNGRMALFYKPTPRECSSCHGPNVTN